MRERLALAILALAGAAACGPVKHATIRPDFDQVDRTRLLRLAVVTAPLPAGSEAVGNMWSLMARRYVNHHRDFIAKVEVAAAEVPEGVCEEGLDGVLHLAPRLEAKGEGAEALVEGRLFRCADGVEVWRAEAGGSWPSRDENVQTVIAEYTDELGPEVTPFVAPSFHVLRALLDTLPRPVLERDEDILEKIEVGE
ncbi:MAG: MXAN_6521/LA_1396 family lipoprotein [Deltaproteobacteria bacterium]|nr:MXAN_6521/LA_1396 family lipoprotein [Deltaproteobacteria bacterium]